MNINVNFKIKANMVFPQKILRRQSKIQWKIILNKVVKREHGKTFNASMLYKKATQNDRRICQEKWNVKYKPGT